MKYLQTYLSVLLEEINLCFDLEFFVRVSSETHYLTEIWYEYYAMRGQPVLYSLSLIYFLFEWNSVVGIATSYELDCPGFLSL